MRQNGGNNVGNFPVKLDDLMVGIIESLITERNQAQTVANQSINRANAAQAKLDFYVKQCAACKNIDLDSYSLDETRWIFVRKRDRQEDAKPQTE